MGSIRLRRGVAAAAAFFLLFCAGPAAAALSQKDAALYRQAFSAAAEGKWSYARARADMAHDRLLAKAIRWLEMADANADVSFEQRTDFIADNPDWPQDRLFLQRLEESLDDSTADDAVIKWFSAHEPVTPRGLVRWAEALNNSGATAEAEALLRRAWIESDFPLSEERTFLARHRKMLRAEDHWARLDRLLWDGKYDAARRMLRKVDQGHQALAEARMRLRRMEGAVDWAINRVPKELKNDPGLTYERLRWRRRKDKTDSALEILLHPPPDLGRPELWWNERGIIARQLLARGDISLAYKVASQHGTTSGAAFIEAEWLSGWIALRFLQEPKKALRHFARGYEGVLYPTSRARAAYWAGRAAEAIEAGSKLAQDWYGRAAVHITTYHGQLASHRLTGEKGLQLPSDPQPTVQDKQLFEAREIVRVVRQLDETGQAEMARPFVLRLLEIGTSLGEIALAGQLAIEIGRPDVAVTLAKRALKNNIVLTGPGYPVPLQPPADGPEPALVMAVMRQESAFDVVATSSAGARGLMQLMPATAKQMARSLGLKYSGRRLHSDPEYNLKLGTAYLNDLLQRYDGSYVLALTAYNAGPARMWRWTKENGDPRSRDVDAIDWIEMIPFTETRDYVQRVLENVQIYRLLTGSTSVAQSIEDDLHIPATQN